MSKRPRRPAFGLVDTSGLSSPTRRQFLQAGGMLMAFMLTAHRPALAQALSAGAASPASWDPNASFDRFTPNGFIRIGRDDSILLIAPNTEMGQGVYTGQATLIAEELEVDLDQVIVVPAPPDSELYAQPILGSQATGNSTSIRAFWEPLRLAGAAARTMLVGAAAARFEVDATELQIERGTVIHPQTNRRASYGALVEDALSQPLPQNVQLKPRDQFRLIGRSLRRVDTPAKVRGETLYGIDVRLEGMRTATVAASPVTGGRLVDVDERAAREMPGVVDVLRIDNAVAVVGEHFWAARKGLEALRITWDDGPNAGFSSAQMLADLEQALGTVPAVPARDDGDVDTAFQQAERTVEAIYTLPFLAHAALEPINTTVHVRPDLCEIWVGTQVPVSARTIAAGVLDVDESKVLLHNFQMGGAFGRRLTVESIDQAVMFARQVDYPLKVIWTREEDIRHDVYRPMYRDHISAALGPDGLPTGWIHHVTGGSVLNSYIPGGFPQGELDSDAVSGAAELPYRIENMRVDWTRVDPPVSVSWWRGVGETHNAFVVESFVDELAHAAGRDPVEYRLAMLGDNPRGAEVVRVAAERSGWGDPLSERRGRGISLHEAFTSPLALVVEVEVNEDGQILLRRIVAAIDCGVAVNPDTIRAQIEGGVLFGLSAALYNGITIENGRVVESNFNDYRQLRIDEVPPIEVHIVESGENPGGVGESATVSAAPSLGNAIFAATGVRLRDLPFESARLVQQTAQEDN